MKKRKKEKRKKKRIEILVIIIICVIVILFLSIFVHAPMEIETTTPEAGQDIWVQCESTVYDVTCVKVRVKDVSGNVISNCVIPEGGLWGWVEKVFGGEVKYECRIPAVREIKIECYVDTDICYTTQESVLNTITIQLCDEGFYYDVGGICKDCGGVRFCSDAEDPTYCGVTDGICPSTYGANCANNADCSDTDC